MHINIMNQKELPFKMKYFKNYLLNSNSPSLSFPCQKKKDQILTSFIWQKIVNT